MNNNRIKLKIMDLDKVLIKLEKQGWKLEKHFLEVNENFLQDLVDETEKQLILSGVSQLLIAWEQYKKANWWESDSIDVQKVLIKQFEAIYCG